MMKMLFASAFFLLSVAAAAHGVRDVGGMPPDGYCPPLISNGDLNMLVDWWGGQGTNDYYHLKTEVYWQGRRGVARNAELFGFGRFNPTLSIDGHDAGLPREWRQTLDVTNAVVLCEGLYPGVRVETDVFCALHRNIVGIRRSFASTDGVSHRVACGLDYAIKPHRRLVGDWRQTGEMRRYAGRTYGHRVIDFTVSVLSPGGSVAREFALEPGARKTVEWFVVFTDSFEEAAGSPAARADALCADMRRRGFDDLFAEHARRWGAYYAESRVNVPDARIQRMYDVAQYHLRCNAGRWGFPVGIFPHHWQGKYFGFDETYMHDGLVASGHFDVARRCPDWRHAVMPWAEKRQGYYQKPGKYGARWMWMSLEDGDIDVAGIGFWMDHIFAMGTIARSAWTQWQYSGDRDWLAAKGYPVIRNCALFFRNNWIVEEGDGVARIGRCTDLERLGPSRDRAFMTTCGAIYAMRAAADAAAILSTNREESVDFRAAADRLEKGLPVSKDGTRYVAYENCEEESVGTLAGLYPFPIFGADNARQASAARHFLAVGKSAGNMYPMGRKVCPWYAGKMAASLVALGDRSEPYRWLSEAAGAQGLFGETWEINEPGLRIHPWFTTASGTCAYALAQMLLAEIDGVLHIAPGVPAAWKDYSFSLPAPNGVWVDCEVKDGEIARQAFRATQPSSVEKVSYVFRGEKRVAGLCVPASVRPVSCIGMKRSWDPSPGWWEKRHAAKLAEIAASGGEIDLVFVGDSITHNWEGARGPGSDYGGKPLAELKKRYSVLNLGFGGDRTQNVLWRLLNGELDGYTAKCIVLMIGTNNGGKPEETAAGIKAILDLIVLKQPLAKVVLHPIFPSGATADHPWRVRNSKVNELIRPFVDGRRVIWCDFNARFLNPDGTFPKGMMMDDNLHPLEPGYTIWAEAAAPLFKEICRK